MLIREKDIFNNQGLNMPLPININELINGSTVEWERIEFKEGWNPEIILHTICAFANDVNNWGGGYLIIGIAEKDGRAILPPKGLKVEELDNIQKKIHELCHKIVPAYFPIVEPYVIDKKHILVVWVPGGEARPYKASQSLARKSEKSYYIRRLSSSAKANINEEQQLLQLTAKIPFDDRANHHATIDDFSMAEIRIFLQDVKSDLFDSAIDIPFEELVRSMQIARGATEALYPINAGLLFFSEDVEKFFPYTRIEVNIYHDDIGDNFTEKVFHGAIHQQLRQALSLIKTLVIEEHVQKIAGQAEAIRFYNYPFQAVEEALANAVYHKNYEEREPIEVNVRQEKIEILSHGGAMPPIMPSDFQKERIISRKYLNRRIGDFLKELHLTEGKGTGIPKIKRAMRNNGSDAPIFETDEERSYFLVILPARFVDVVIKPDTLSLPSDTIAKNDRLRPITTDYDQFDTLNIDKDEEQILKYILMNKTITRKEAVDILNYGETKIKELFSSMIDKQFIKRVGQGRGTHYILEDNI